jgi:hypothetical protein
MTAIQANLDAANTINAKPASLMKPIDQMLRHLGRTGTS